MECHVLTSGSGVVAEGDADAAAGLCLVMASSTFLSLQVRTWRFRLNRFGNVLLQNWQCHAGEKATSHEQKGDR